MVLNLHRHIIIVGEVSSIGNQSVEVMAENTHSANAAMIRPSIIIIE